MNALHFSLAIALAGLLAGCGGGGGGASSATAQPDTVTPPAVDYFPLDIGNGWSYSDGSTARVIASVLLAGQQEVQIRSLDSSGTTDEYYQKSGSAVTLVPGGDADAFTAALGPVTLMRLPVREDDTYVAVDRNLDGRFDLDGDGRADNLSVHAEVSVVEIGPLVTAAGTLANTAHLRTVVTETARSSLTGRQATVTLTSDDWYAPGIGPVKNATFIKNADGSTLSSSQEIRQYHTGSLRSASTPPAVTATSPAAGGALPSALVSVIFGEDMDTLKTSNLGLTLSDATGQTVAGQAVWDDRRTLRFQPAQALSSGSYRVRLAAGAENLAGNTVTATQSWDFLLDKDGPVLVGITPADGSGEVAPDSSIRITFDEPVDLASALSRIALHDDKNFINLTATLSLDGNAVVLKPTAPLGLRSNYSVIVSTGVADVLGNAGASTANTHFTTDPGWFTLAHAVPALGSVRLSRGSVAADFDGDGHMDLAVATAESPTTVRVLPGRGDGTFGTPRDFVDPTIGSHALFAADLDGDGRAELISLGSSRLQQWHWDASGQVTEMPVPAMPAGMSLASAGVLRIAADGERLALVADDIIGGQRMLWRQSVPGVFAAAIALPTRNSAYQDLALTGDINGDGFDDLVYAGAEPGDMLVLLQQANGSFVVGPAIAGLPNSARYRLVDFNGDGRPDIVYATSTDIGSTSIGVLLHQADHSFAAGPVLAIGCISCDLRDFAAADLDGDGRVDFVAISSHFVSFLRQAADGSVGSPDIYFRSDSFGDLVLADFNGDGRLDVLAASDLLLQRPTAGIGGSAARRGIQQQRLVGGTSTPGSRR